jgi:hypothetical protein
MGKQQRGMQDGPDLPPIQTPLTDLDLDQVKGGGLGDDPDPTTFLPQERKIIVDDGAPI